RRRRLARPRDRPRRGNGGAVAPLDTPRGSFLGGSPPSVGSGEARQADCRSNSHAAKQRMWTWYLSNPAAGVPRSRANWISNSISVDLTGSSQIVHEPPTPGPPHGRSGVRPGRLAFRLPGGGRS